MSIGITFFAKQPFRVGHDHHLARLSSLIRANQIAEYIDAKLNPTEGYENDVCIYVKPYVVKGADFNFEGKPYLDICDSPDLYQIARKHPEVTVITASDWNYELCKKVLPNKVININEQHCNFEHLKRIRKGITAVGCIGTIHAFPFLPQGLREKLTERGIKLIEFSRFNKREDVVNFYLNIDVQIIWRPYYKYNSKLLANPLKVVNASSFGIPTIAYDEPTFTETQGCYIGVRTLDEFLFQLDTLRDNPDLYEKYSIRCLEKSKEYDIDKIAQLYKNLLNEKV